MLSLKTIEKILKPDIGYFKAHRFELDIDLPPSENPIRSYTLNLENNRRLIVTGANIINDFHLIVFRKK
jgi:hypothetical protein